MVDERLIERAQSLMAWMTDVEAYEKLVEEKVDKGCAFLAVKAANLAPTLPVKEGPPVEAVDRA